MYNTTWPHLFWKIFVDFLTSTLLRAQNTTLLSKVRRNFFRIFWTSQKTQTLTKTELSTFFLVKVLVFWEGHKIWKNLCRTFDKSVVFCARNSVLVKKSTKIFQNKCGQVVLYKLWKISQQFIILKWLDPLAPGCGDPGSF